MPFQPSWIDQVPEILAGLESLPFPFLDRVSVQGIFGLSARQANRLIRTTPGSVNVGRSALVSREALLDRLRICELSGQVEREQKRRGHLHEILGLARNTARRRAVPIPMIPDAWQLDFDSLSEGIHLGPGNLTIHFSTPVDLLQKLFGLAQAISNDPMGFENRSSMLT